MAITRFARSIVRRTPTTPKGWAPSSRPFMRSATPWSFSPTPDSSPPVPTMESPLPARTYWSTPRSVTQTLSRPSCMRAASSPIPGVSRKRPSCCGGPAPRFGPKRSGWKRSNWDGMRSSSRAKVSSGPQPALRRCQPTPRRTVLAAQPEMSSTPSAPRLLHPREHKPDQKNIFHNARLTAPPELLLSILLAPVTVLDYHDAPMILRSDPAIARNFFQLSPPTFSPKSDGRHQIEYLRRHSCFCYK